MLNERQSKLHFPCKNNHSNGKRFEHLGFKRKDHISADIIIEKYLASAF